MLQLVVFAVVCAGSVVGIAAAAYYDRTFDPRTGLRKRDVAPVTDRNDVHYWLNRVFDQRFTGPRDPRESDGSGVRGISRDTELP